MYASWKALCFFVAIALLLIAAFRNDQGRLLFKHFTPLGLVALALAVFVLPFLWDVAVIEWDL